MIILLFSRYIGGGCSVVCEPVALISAEFNLPHVSWGCTSEALSNKYNYPTFARSVGHVEQTSKLFYTGMFPYCNVLFYIVLYCIVSSSIVIYLMELFQEDTEDK